MHHDAVYSGIYAAAIGRLDWQVALKNVAELLGLLFVQVLGIDKHNGQLVFSSHGGHVSAQAALDYFRHYNSIDPRVALAMSTPTDEWMHCHHHLDDVYVAQSEFYQDFLIPLGGRYVASTRLLDENSVQFYVAFSRGFGSEPLGQTEFGLMHQLKHHFTEAFRNLVHLRETYAELGMARELLGQFAFPMLLVDEMGGIWHRNAMARQLLLLGDPVGERQGYLTCGSAIGQKALADALHSLQLDAATASAAAAPRRKAIALPTTDGRRFLAFVSAVRPDTAMGAFGRAPRALVILHDTRHYSTRTQFDPLILGECFGLTPAEARVAMQVAAGANPKQIALRSGAAVATVRTQLQCVMAKTEVERQTDLVRVLMALPIRR